jgi:16S rRNA (cytosine1402-N4)-methyltransferase
MKKENHPEYHVPVLLQEAVDALQIKSAGIYVDCTFGGGGHSREMLRRMGSEGKLIAFDQDADARKNLPEDDRIIFVPHNFRHLQRFLKLHKIQAVDGILADLGVSSHQFDEGERGFSTRSDDAALDMRMDRRQELTAQAVLAEYPEQKLHKLFEQYGEVTNAKTLAKTIVEARSITPFRTIADFKSAVHDVVKGNPNKYFAQVFQSLRIEVNDELGALKEMLEQVPNVLKAGGRIAVITFHSIEDRMVKIFFKEGGFEGRDEYDLYGGNKKRELRVVTKKPVTPSEKEMRANPRSRSAKLRVAEKTANGRQQTAE